MKFAVNWDYRCPFARNAHEHVVTALRAGAEWDVDFVAFSLSQGHREEGDPPVWEDPAKVRDLLGDGDRLRPVYYGLAVVVATSRIYVRIHHASDVLAGAVLGAALGRLGRRLYPLNRPEAGID